MRNKQFIFVLKYAAIAGNILFILWPTYNAVNAIYENIESTLPEKISYVTLMVLLVVNIFLLLTSKPRNRQNNE